MNISGRFPLALTGLTSLLSKGLSEVFPILASDGLYQWSSECAPRTSNISTSGNLLEMQTLSPQHGLLNQILE